MSMSLQSNALEPPPGRAPGTGVTYWANSLSRQIPVYGLPVVGLLLILFFSLSLEGFFSWTTLKYILISKSVIAILALAAMVPMVAGKIDLSIGYGITLWHIVAISLQVYYGISWELAVVIVLALGTLLGFINGMLVELAKIDAFIATLGTGTVIYAISQWHTDGQQVVGNLPDGFLDINGIRLFGELPLPAVYLLVITLALWIVLDYLPIGRFLYATGANPRSAALNGIPVRRYVIGAFMTSGFLCAFAGVVLASKLRIGQSVVGLEFLLPALVGAFLGSTTIKPGRVNVWGTIVGVGVLSVGIAGIQRFGSDFFVEPLFNGLTLIIAVSIAGYAGRRRLSVNRPADVDAPKRDGPTPESVARKRDEASSGTAAPLGIAVSPEAGQAMAGEGRKR